MAERAGTRRHQGVRAGAVARGVSSAVVCAALSFGATNAAQTAPTIAAASDLQFALSEVATAFAADRGERVNLVFGSSGMLARQIRDGAPFELFLSADERFVADLSRAGLTRDDGDLYAVGRVVLFAPHDSPLSTNADLTALSAFVDRGGGLRFAIANPEHAPYGRAAEEVLRAHGLWQRLQPFLVLGENVSQAAQFATTGNAVGGVIAYSLALAPAVKERGTFVLLPETDHQPLRQRMVRMKRAGPVTDRFYLYLREPKAREILTRYGFVLEERR